MKKVLSLLFVALLAMSAWADTVVTVDFSQQNFGDQQQIHELNIDGVILGFDKGTNSNNPPTYFDTGASIRLYGGNTMKVVAEQNIKKIDFTFGSGDGDNNILCDVGNYNKAGKQWTIGSSDPSKQVMFTIEGSSGHRRVHQLVITIEDANPVTELVPPVFHPEDGTTFTNSLEVSITCPTQNAEIEYYEVIDGEIDWATYHYYTAPFYINETKTFAAFAKKSGEYSDATYATYTKVEQTVEAPVFTPAACGFYDRIEVTLTCATPDAKIFYSLDNELWSPYINPIPVTTDLTIWAKAMVDVLESEVVSATYTKLPGTTVDVTFDATVDKGDGDTERHEYTVVKEPVTMYVGDGTVYEDHYRIYAGAEYYFESEGAPIIRIEFNGMSNNTASNLSLADGTTGTWTTGGTDGLWEGNAQRVEFNVNKQARFTTIIVTLASSTKRGDVNGNGLVDMDDLTALINYLLDDSTTIYFENTAICNSLESNIVDMDDLTALINYLLTNEWPD